MPKTIVSPVPRFPGEVVLPDYLNFVQEAAWQDAIEQIEGKTRIMTVSFDARLGRLIWPAIEAIVLEWRLQGVPEHPTLETFPTTPKLSAARLYAWIISEITGMHEEANEVPLA